MRSVLVWLMVLSGDVFVPTKLPLTPVPTCHPAEFFVADNTDPLFEIQADVTITQNGATPTGSTPLDGVYWATLLQQTTEEPSREFHLCTPDELTLHTVAEALRRQFDQQAVLTFDYLSDNLPEQAPAANAVAISVPNIDPARFRAAFASSSAAHSRLRGGSVTATDHTLILIAGTGDLDTARQLVGEAGGSWDAATIAYGRRDFVDG
jgi:hypothetical protein